MDIPKQATSIEKDRQALAPYNFIELPERIVKVSLKDLPDQDHFDSSRHSGWLDCQLTTASPTYVRAALTQEQVKEQKKAKDIADFFFVQQENIPIIPGSTLRGMFRSLIEIISYSKVVDVSDSKLIYRAVGDTTSHGEQYRNRIMRDHKEKRYTPKMLGGYLSKKGSDWYIEPAQEINGTTFAVLKPPTSNSFYFDNLRKQLPQIDNCRNAYKIYVKVGPYDFQDVRGGFIRVRQALAYDPSSVPKTGWIEGTLAISGPMNSKRSEAVIFTAKKEVDALHLSDELIANYRNQISKEQKKILGDNGALNDGQPVFYILKDDGSVEFFGHCRMLRIPYTRTPQDLIPQELRREEDIDLTEAIFGYIKQSPKRGNSHSAYASRIAFSEATLMPNQQNIWLSNHSIIPQTLGSPKPTTFQHYLVQRQANKSNLSDYNASNTLIRGHKIYWHKGAVNLQDIELKEKPKENIATHIKPLRADLKFTFRIRFDNLSDVELGALLWVLRIARDDRYRLKLGMGKPLGMGAIKIDSSLKLIERETRYSKLFTDNNWADGAKDEPSTNDIAQRAIPAFEKFVLEQLNRAAIRQLKELERIKQLLTMLSWPGPNKALTRYFEIEHPDPTAKRGKRNEYKERPVLPSATMVFPFNEGANLDQQISDINGSESNSSLNTNNLLSTNVSKKVENVVQTATGTQTQPLSIHTLWLKIKRLRGKKDIDQVANIVDQLETINDRKQRQERAIDLQKWLKQENFWMSNQYKTSAWHKKLETMLR